MHPSKLQLKSYHFSKINITAQEKFDDKVECDIKCQISISEAKEAERMYQVILAIKLENPEVKKSKYIGEMEIQGVFEVSEAVQKEKRETLISVNASSVLWGSLREMVYNLTSRGPWGAIMLPTVSFYEPTKDAKKQEGGGGNN